MFKDNAGSIRRIAWVSVAVLMLACGAGAQVTVGDNLHMDMAGSLGFGYSGGWVNDGGSSHGTGFGFDGQLNGYYFDPRFVKFDFRPYFNRNQSNSDYQSITRGSGLGGSVGFFSNTVFPGSISYGKDFSMNSEFQVAGVPSVIGNSSSQSLGISWSLLLPDKPTLTASYGVGSSTSDISGTSIEGSSSNRNLSLGSTYQWAGWNMHGAYSHFNNTYTSPAFVTGESVTRSGNSSVYTFNAQHQIPINGNFSFGWSHSSGGSDNQDYSSSSSYSVGAGITPWSRLGLSSSFSYTTNLSQALAYSLLGPGAGTLSVIDRGTSGLFAMNSASLAIGHGFNVNGHFSWRQENFPTATYTDTQYGGTLTYHYTHRMLGSFYVSGGAIDSANKLGNTGTGLTGTAGMDRRFGHWETSADINYMHNVQTLYSIVNTSSMNYGGTVRRKINPQTYLATFFRASRSGLATQSGAGNLANSYGASLSWKGYSFTGSYSASNGTAILAGSGTLISTPTGPLFTPDFVYFDAKAYSVAASKRFYRKLIISGVYSQVESSTAQKNGNSNNSGNRFGVTTTYQMRKMALLGGFTRSSQTFSTIVGGPRVVNSYYVSFSRWFNIF